MGGLVWPLVALPEGTEALPSGFDPDVLFTAGGMDSTGFAEVDDW